MKWAWTAIGNALLIKHKVGGYLLYFFPSYFISIHRIDVERHRVFNDYNTRSMIIPGQFYLVAAWNRSTSRYHRMFVRGEMLIEDVGGDKWQHGSVQQVLDAMVTTYDNVNPQESNILAIMIGEEDVTHEYGDIRASLAKPKNVTAEAFAILHTQKQESASFRAMTLEIMENTLEEVAPPSKEAKITLPPITIVDFDINEKVTLGSAFLVG